MIMEDTIQRTLLLSPPTTDNRTNANTNSTPKLIPLVDSCSPCDWVLLHIPIVIHLKLLHAGQKIFFDKQLRRSNSAYLASILVASGWRRQ